MEDLESAREKQYRKAIAWAITLSADTPLAPEQYEWALLEQYGRGEVCLQEVLHLLDNRIYHLLYRSQARHPFNSADLTALLEQSQRWNLDHHVTGLLCYSTDGQFVQILEGTAADVHGLFSRIQQDKRHFQVQALSNRASGQRWFAEWQMALVEVEPSDFYWLLGYLEAQGHNLVKPQVPINSLPLKALLQSFSRI